MNMKCVHLCYVLLTLILPKWYDIIRVDRLKLHAGFFAKVTTLCVTVKLFSEIVVVDKKSLLCYFTCYFMTNFFNLIYACRGFQNTVYKTILRAAEKWLRWIFPKAFWAACVRDYVNVSAMQVWVHTHTLTQLGKD